MAKRTYGDQNGVDRKPRPTGGEKGTYDAPFVGYINLNLTDEQKAAYAAWAESGSLWATLEGAVADGVNIYVKWEAKAETFLASATQRRTTSPNAGLVVTARGRDASTAFGRVLFCLAILGRKEKWTDTQPLSDPDRW